MPRDKENWRPQAINVEAKSNATEVWCDKNSQPWHLHTNCYVDSTTRFYGAALFQLRRQDFGEIKHDGGISPAWPITYEENLHENDRCHTRQLQ